MELISIITPAFNASATLLRAHQSVREQSHTLWEHIIVDDGSTDDTLRIVRELMKDARVKGRSIPNRGTGGALNAGLEMAQGAYIAFLDADDEYTPVHLSSHLAVLNERPDVDLLWGGQEVIAKRHEDTMVPDVEKGFGLISVTDCVVQGTLFARPAVFSKVRFTEDRSIWFQDYEFVKRVREHFNVERFPLPTLRYYRDSGQSTVDRVKAQVASQ